MPKRYNLPPLAFFQGFEAAARTLSFTKAAEELFITQSAVSRQIKALEDHLGIRLFERRPRALALTESGQALQRISADVLERLQAATDQLRAASRTRQLAITTTTGFASLWLIPRLQRFTSVHPDVDVRISATTDSNGRALNRSPKTDLWQKSHRNGQPRVDIRGVVASFQCFRQ